MTVTGRSNPNFIFLGLRMLRFTVHLTTSLLLLLIRTDAIRAGFAIRRFSDRRHPPRRLFSIAFILRSIVIDCFYSFNQSIVQLPKQSHTIPRRFLSISNLCGRCHSPHRSWEMFAITPVGRQIKLRVKLRVIGQMKFDL